MYLKKKILQSSLIPFTIFFFWPHPMSYGTLITWTGMEPAPSEVEAEF